MCAWFAYNLKDCRSEHRFRVNGAMGLLAGPARFAFVALLALLILTGCRSSRSGEITATRIERLHGEPTPVELHTQEIINTEPTAASVSPATPTEPPLVETPGIAVPEASTPKAVVAPEHQTKKPRPNGPMIALTFDDGPNPINTPALLDLLKQRGITATFFVLGHNAALYPAILQRMVAEGHEVGSHGWNHLSLTELSPEQRTTQVRKTSEAIEHAIGHAPNLIRPPYGATNPGLNRWLTEDLHMRVVLWTVDSRDWEHHDPSSIRREILSATKPGAIILAHDIHRTTVAAMPAILDDLLAKGFNFVTVSELNSPRASR